MAKEANKRMGRPGDSLTKHPHTLNFPDVLWEAIEKVKGNSEFTEYIMEHLQAIPEVAAYLERKRKR